MHEPASTAGVPAWVRDAVFYQVFPDRFAWSERVHRPGPMEDWLAPPTVHGFKGGDLYGIAERLDYLEELGVTALYLNPVFASAANHRYHTYDYLAVDPLLGGDAALRELLDVAHGRGMRVVLDGVFNHAGRGFWPFHHVLETGVASPYRDWFHLNPDWLTDGRQLLAYPDQRPAGGIESGWAEEHRAGEASLHRLGYRAWWDLPALPKLNVDNPEMRAYLLDVAEHWIRFGADGWRLDVPSEIGDMAFWAELRQRVRAANPEAYLVGEIWDLDDRWVGPAAFDGLMNYPLAWALIGFAGAGRLDQAVVDSHDTIRSALRPLDAEEFAARLEAALGAYPTAFRAGQLNLLGSHDTPRVLSLCGGDEASVRLAILLLLALPGAPSIYYGDEVGMAGGADPDCRRAFDWSPRSWNGPLRDWVRRALVVRKRQPALRADAFRTLAADGMTCAFGRSDDAGSSLLVAANAGAEGAVLVLDREVSLGEPLLATDGRPASARLDPGGLRLELPGRWGGIWRRA